MDKDVTEEKYELANGKEIVVYYDEYGQCKFTREAIELLIDGYNEYLKLKCIN